jgi:hypothetical protein
MADGDLLTPVVAHDQQHTSFKSLVGEPRHAPACDLLRQVWAAFPNPDDHFIREFQTHGFDARVWELALFCVGLFGPHEVTRPAERPDFRFERNGVGVWIEAVTSNASAKPPAEMAAEGADEVEVKFHEMNNVLPIRLGSPLYSKLQKKYWELPHVAGQPLVIAIEDFSDSSPTRMSDAPLFRYLYGMEHRVVSLPGELVRIEEIKIAAHHHGDKMIPSGYFDLPGAENVSAVIFSNEGTIPKFNRMAFEFNKYPGLRMIRVGSCMDFDPTATVPQAFGWLVGDFPEEWGHGMSVYHNPNALHPIPIDFFDGFSGRHWFEAGRYENLFREFTPYSSLTILYSTNGYADRLAQLDERLRREAAEKAQEYAAMIHGEAEFLAWRDRFIS